MLSTQSMYAVSSYTLLNPMDSSYGVMLQDMRPSFDNYQISTSLVNGILKLWRDLFTASDLTSSGNEEVATIQQPAIESNKTVCNLAMNSVAELPASYQKNLAYSLLVSIRKCIMNQPLYAECTPFCPISFSIDDDESIILEWAYLNGRISYYIDPVISESTAVFVDALEESGIPRTRSIPISADKVSELAAESVSFIARLV